MLTPPGACSPRRTRPSLQSKDQFRAIMRRHGQVFAGQHVCHIIAGGSGGADHPDNYVMGDGGLNTSFGM